VRGSYDKATITRRGYIEGKQRKMRPYGSRKRAGLGVRSGKQKLRGKTEGQPEDRSGSEKIIMAKGSDRLILAMRRT
jgi:hypothetical protein